MGHGGRPPTTVGVRKRVSGLSCDVVCVILRLAGFGTVPACDRQTDKQTDGHTMTANTRAIAQRRACKN